MSIPLTRIWRPLLGLATVATLAFFSSTGGQNPSLIKLAQVQEKTIESQISASGAIKSENTITLRFPTSGKISKIFVDEGDYVKQGQIITALDAEKFEITQRIAQQDLNLADAILSQVYDDLKKFPQPENFDQKIKRTNAETAKNKAYDALIKAQKDLADAQIITPFDSIITKLSVSENEQISPAMEIAKLSDFTNLNFITQVDETDIAKISFDQSAEIALDAFPQETITATVTSIAKVSTATSTGATAFEVTLKMPAEQKFSLGMNGQAQITVESAQNLAIPQEALADGNFVWTKVGKTYQKREITTGLSSDTDIEVKAGLNQNDQIVIGGFEELTKKSFLQKIASLWS